MARVRQNAEKTYLCAVRFWGISPTVPTLRSGVRHVVRKQAFSPREIDKAERSLSQKGLIVLGGRGTGKSVVLTAKAAAVSCKTTKLAPWTNAGYPGAALAGRRRGRGLGFSPEMHRRSAADWASRRDEHARSARALATSRECTKALETLTYAAFADGEAAAHRRSSDRTPGSLSIFPTRDAVIKACVRRSR